jgi:hypothetical protein
MRSDTFSQTRDDAMGDDMERQERKEMQDPAFVTAQIESKVLEIRDRGTFIAALAIRMLGANPTQAYYFRRCGYPADGSSIILMVLYDGKATNDAWEWASLGKGTRTMRVAHGWILDHYTELDDGDVVDVEFILEESKEPKVSERERRA